MTLNTVLTNKEGTPLAPATTAEQVAYDNTMNVKQAIDTRISNGEYTEIKNEIDVERKRINNIASLPDGSTTGDAELQDIRVGFDGVTHENAGEAVREQISYLKNNVDDVISGVTGGNLYLVCNAIDNMLNGAGEPVSATSSLKFYQINDLHNATIISIIQSGVAEYDTHYVNQLDKNGDVISYTVIHDKSSLNFSIILDENCTAVNFSMWSDAGSFIAFCELPNKISEINLKITSITGGKMQYNPVTTSKMYGSDGSEKQQGNDLLFFYIPDTFGAQSILFSVPTPGKSAVHWFNQFDAEGNILSYTPFNINSGDITVDLLKNTKSVKYSIWSDNGNVTAVGNMKPLFFSSPIVGQYKKLSALGDSITYGYSTEGQIINTYQRLIADAIKAEFQNLGISSTPICPNSDYADGQNDNAFVYRINQIAQDADLILICGGTNDFRHKVPLGTLNDTESKYQETFYGAIDYLINQIVSAHTTARLVFITPFHQIGDTIPKITLDGTQAVLLDYVNAIKSKCEQYGILCIDGYAISGCNLTSTFVTNCMPDSLHPNEAGHKLIYKNLIHYFV